VFERFTESARQVIVLAQDEARALRHNYLGTEHLLLGVLRSDSAAAKALGSLGVALEPARAQVAAIVGQMDHAPVGQVPFTPRAKKVLEVSLREAVGLGHSYIGPEHILLGLARENDGVALRVLLDAGADASAIRAVVEREVPGDPPGAPVWVQSPNDVAFVRVTHGGSEDRQRLLGLWLAARAVWLAAAIVFGLGLLVGWLIWG
jgi:ATP-dependent Clp protease ATP-binding subunit ClpC